MNVLKRYDYDKSLWDDWEHQFWEYLLTNIDPGILLRLESEDPVGHKKLTAFIRCCVMRFVSDTGKGRQFKKMIDQSRNNTEIGEWIKSNEDDDEE